MIVVSGVTGQTGAVVARHLVAAGRAVRGLSRNPEATVPGGSLATVDLADTEALTAQLGEAEAFYAVLPPQWGAPDMFEATAPIVDGLVGAIEAADVPRVVVLSSVAVQEPEGTGPIRALRPLEARLATRPGVTFLRAAYFVENLGSVVDSVRQGQLPTFWEPSQAVSAVSVADIGRTAAELLQQSPTDAPRVVQLAGPDDVSFSEVARQFGTLLGRQVDPLPLPPRAITPTLQEMGAGHLAELYGELNEGIATGVVRFDPAYDVVRGTEPLAQSLGRLLG